MALHPVARSVPSPTMLSLGSIPSKPQIKLMAFHNNSISFKRRAYNICCCNIPKSHTGDTMTTEVPVLTNRRHSNTTLQLRRRLQHLESLKHEIWKRNSELPESSLEQLEMIDAIQRLRVDYLFQQEITDALRHQYEKSTTSDTTTTGLNRHNYNNKLHEVALRFRLLRQEGYDVASDIAFSSFKGKDIGEFILDQQPLISNDHDNGLMSLFEASQMITPEEESTWLDESYTFCLQYLMINSTSSSSSSLEGEGKDHDDPCSRTLLVRALKHPDHYKALARFMASSKDILYQLKIKNGSSTKGWRNDLIKLAEMELKFTEALHQKEMNEFLSWWKGHGLEKDLKFARDQPLKCYELSIKALPSLYFSQMRVQLTKPISFIHVIDDIFKVNGALDHEIVLFTEAVNRWQIACYEDQMLPAFMQTCLNALYETTMEFSQRILSQYGWNPQFSLQKQCANLLRACLVESKWRTSGELPTSKEYLKVGIVASGVPLSLTYLLIFLGEGSLQKLDDNYLKIISSTATIICLWDDIMGADPEGLDVTYIHCYMNEQKDISFDNARQYVIRMISDEWKLLNKYSLLLSQNRTSTAYTFSKVCLNAAKTVSMVYNVQR